MLFVFHSYRKPRVRPVDWVLEGGLTSEKPPPSNSATLPSPEFSSIPLSPLRTTGSQSTRGLPGKRNCQVKWPWSDSFYSSLRYSSPRLLPRNSVSPFPHYRIDESLGETSETRKQLIAGYCYYYLEVVLFIFDVSCWIRFSARGFV